MYHSLKSLIHIMAALALAGACSSVYAAVAGHVQFVYGAAQLTTEAGKTRVIEKGDAVYEGDTLTTAPTASAQVRMEDGGFIAVRPDSKLKFDTFKFDGHQDGSERSFFSLFKGGLRAITGLIGKINKADYHISTPSGTIGIRGTDHETVVVVPGSPLALLAPVGTYNKVNLGETTLTTNKGTISILPNQMGFVGGIDQMPKLQPINLKIFSIAPDPALQAKNGGGVQPIRSHAVEDNFLQGASPIQGDIFPSITSVTQDVVYGSAANANFILQPVTATLLQPNGTIISTTTTTTTTSVISPTTGQTVIQVVPKILSLF